MEVARLAAKNGLWDVARETAHALQDQLSPAAAAAAVGPTATATATPGVPPNTPATASTAPTTATPMTPAQQQQMQQTQASAGATPASQHASGFTLQPPASSVTPASRAAGAATAPPTATGNAPSAPHERTYDITVITVDLELLLCEIDASAIPEAYTKANVDVRTADP